MALAARLRGSAAAATAAIAAGPARRTRTLAAMRRMAVRPMAALRRTLLAIVRALLVARGRGRPQRLECLNGGGEALRQRRDGQFLPSRPLNVAQVPTL